MVSILWKGIGLENDLLPDGANCFRITVSESKINRTISAAFCHLCSLTEPSVVPTTYVSFNVTLQTHKPKWREEF
jgi:hypothetical protein